MPKRSIQAFRPQRIRPDHRVYSDDNIEAIITAAGGMPSGVIDHEILIHDAKGFRREAHRVPRRQVLRERLEKAAHIYITFSEYQTEPTPNQIADAMADIEEAAATLIAALHLPEAMEQDLLASMPTALRYGALQAEAALEASELDGLPRCSGEGLLRDSVHGVYRLHRWARSVKARNRTARQIPWTKKHARDEDLNRLFGDLAGIWFFVFERPIATSVSGPESARPGQAGGPMVRFLSACLKPILNETPSNEAIRSRIRRLFPGQSSAQAKKVKIKS
jgi:hypothetical protein